MRVALVYDRVNKWGGAERVLLSLHELWPDAPLYTAVYDPKRAPWASVFDVRASFLNYLPFARFYHELYPWLTPLAFETFNFDQFDLVISVTSAEAKGIITKPQTCHICYCLTPTRYLWSGYKEYRKDKKMGPMLTWMAPRLRKWDIIAASRPDYYLAISNHVRERITKYYGQKVEKVIYPPVEVSGKRKAESGKLTQNDYFLVVARLVGYKRVDIVIDAFNKLGWPLIIIGDGLARESLQTRAKANIQFFTHYLTDSELGRYYGSCRALICAQDEDFGIAAVEAQSYGKPVITFGGSGVAESVEDGKTGLFFDKQTSTSLIQALERFDRMHFDAEVCKGNAQKFDKSIFQKQMKSTVEKLLMEYRNQ